MSAVAVNCGGFVGDDLYCSGNGFCCVFENDFASVSGCASETDCVFANGSGFAVPVILIRKHGDMLID